MAGNMPMPNIRIFTTSNQPSMDDLNSFTGFNNSKSKKPDIIKYDLHITLEEAYKGTNYSIEIERYNIDPSYHTKTNETVKIDIPIPQGVENNEIIVMKNLGHNINNVIKGDVEIKVIIDEHETFKREKLDLYINIDVSLLEALTSFKFNFTHLNGKPYTINNSNGNIIHPKLIKEIPGLGMKKDNVTGTLKVKFNIIFPESLTTEQIEHLEKALS